MGIALSDNKTVFNNHETLYVATNNAVMHLYPIIPYSKHYIE